MNERDHFVKFTERARKVMSRAQEEAVRFGQSYIGTGHVLLALFREGEGVAAAVLKRLDVDMDTARGAVEDALRQDDEASPGELGLTVRAKKAIELAVDESRRLNHHYIGTEHLLMGLVREGEGTAAGVLTSLGIDLEKAREQTLRVIGQGNAVREAGQERMGGQAMNRMDRLTPQARKVLSQAQEEAQRFNHNYIGTEHLLLGLVRLEEGVSATVFKNLGVELDKVRGAVEFIIGRGDRVVLGEIGLTPRSKKVIELSIAEATLMQTEQIGPEHILLGLVAEGEGIAAGVLESLGLKLGKVRQEVYRVLGLPPPPEREPEETPGIAAPPMERYRPWHIDAEQPQKTPVGTGATPRAISPLQQGIVFGTLLGWVIVNTGGAFTLTLYDGLAEDAPTLAIIRQPPTGAYFPFQCLVRQGLTYTLEGTPGSVTIIYAEARE